MINELIFLTHCTLIGIFALGALRMGKEALISFICVQPILANLFVVKQTTLFGINATVSDAYTVGAVLGLNLLQEYFGRDIAKKSIWISFFLLLFYAIATQIHLAYIPSASDITQCHFEPLLACMPRLVIASFSVFLVVQHIDSWLYAQLKKAFSSNYLVLRNYISVGLSQLLDTVLFSFLGLYGIVDSILEIIVISYVIKLATIIVATPFVLWSKKMVQLNTPTE